MKYVDDIDERCDYINDDTANNDKVTRLKELLNQTIGGMNGLLFQLNNFLTNKVFYTVLKVLFRATHDQQDYYIRVWKDYILLMFPNQNDKEKICRFNWNVRDLGPNYQNHSKEDLLKHSGIHDIDSLNTEFSKKNKRFYIFSSVLAVLNIVLFTFIYKDYDLTISFGIATVFVVLISFFAAFWGRYFFMENKKFVSNIFKYLTIIFVSASVLVKLFFSFDENGALGFYPDLNSAPFLIVGLTFEIILISIVLYYSKRVLNDDVKEYIKYINEAHKVLNSIQKLISVVKSKNNIDENTELIQNNNI